jgi:isoleucyl-tRNA synthetase
MARELVNRIQNIRKNKDFNVTDKIKIQLEQKPEVQAAVDQFGEYIKSEVLAIDLALISGLAHGEALDLPDEVTAYVEVRLA